MPQAGGVGLIGQVTSVSGYLPQAPSKGMDCTAEAVQIASRSMAVMRLSPLSWARTEASEPGAMLRSS